MSRLQLFGSPHIETTGAPVPQFRSRKVEALLYYLAVMPGQHRRIHLANLLWSELPEETALGNLRYALWNLRQVLDKVPLSSDRVTITFQPTDLLWVDVNEFRILLNRANPKRGTTAAKLNAADEVTTLDKVACLQRATDLYRGDFLAGFDLVDAVSFEEWLQFQRTTLHNQAMEAFTQLSDFYVAQGQLPEAVAITQRRLALEPWEEKAHRQLMLYLATLGQRDAALAQYQQCCKVLVAELGVEPDAATQALMEQIRSGKLAPETGQIIKVIAQPAGPQFTESETASKGAKKQPSEAKTAPATPAQPGVFTLPLVGRSREYAWLLQQWQRAIAGESGLVLLRGEAGIGKTRLIEEVSRHVMIEGGLVLRARCYEFSEPLPYQPIAAALHPHLARLMAIAQSSTEKGHRSDTWLAELAQLLPELRQPTESGAPSSFSKHSSDRYRLFEAVAHVLQALSAQQPLLFFLDDLQWADADTLDLMGYLVRRLTDAPFLLVGAYRPGEAINDHALVALQRPLYNEGLDQELTLRPLDRDAVQQIIQLSAPSGASDSDDGNINDSFLHLLYEISQGNPFILTETLHEMQAQGWRQAAATSKAEHEIELVNQKKLQLLSDRNESYQPPTQIVTWQGNPGNESTGAKFRQSVPQNLLLPEVKNRIRRRIARLVPESQQLLSFAAVIGRPFEAKLLQVASGLLPTAVVNCLEDWLKRDLIREVSDQEQPAGKPAFVPKLGKHRYDFNHNLIRTVLYYDLSQVRLQAIHLQLGEALEKLYTGKLEKITEWLAYHFDNADEPQKALCYLQKAGRQAQEVYALPLALKYYQQALAYWEQLYNPADLHVATDAWRQRWDLLLSISEISRMLGHLKKETPGLEIVAQEVTDWGDDHDRLRVIEQQLARLEHSPDLDTRRQLAREGLRLARLLNDALAEGNFLQACGECNRDMANHSEALANYSAAQTKFEQVGQIRQLAFSLIGMGKIHHFNHRFGQALSYFEKATHYAQKEGFQDARIESLTSIARMYLFLGNLEGALTVSQTALSLCKSIGFDSGAVIGLVTQGYVNMLTGNLSLARTQFERAWTISQETEQSLRMADVQCCFGHLCLYERNYGQALQHFKQTEEFCGNFYHGRAIEARSFRAIAHLAMSEWKEALVCSHHAVVWLIGREHSMIAPQRVYLNQYQVLLAQGESEEAQEALVKAHRVVANQLDNLAGAYTTAVDDDWIREQFLTRLPWNQEITTVWDMLPLSNSHVALHFLHGYPG